MSKARLSDLGRRERQIAETVYRLGEASVAKVRGQLPDPPSYSAVRAMLGLLVQKGVLKFRRDGKRYVYRPATPKEKARRFALRNLVATFFGGQATDAVAALLEISATELSEEELDRIRLLIEQARKEDS
jgi:predicted transcriptional regulator